MNIKIKTGYGANDFKLVDMDEAHKAYYIFLNPDARTVFSDGEGIVGRTILGIEPDYHSAMGYNRSHTLDADDWNHIREKGVIEKLRASMETAKDIAYMLADNKHLLNKSLNESIAYLQEKGQLRLN